MAADSSPPKFQYPEWQADCQAALLELDRKKLPERVAVAEAAISKRLQAIAQNPDHTAEQEAIEDARAGLRALKPEQTELPRLEEWAKRQSE